MRNSKYISALLDVQSINITGSASNVDLGGGNTQTFAGSFTKTTGATGNAATAHLVGSLLLSNNNFYRQFTDDPVATTAARALPQMQGNNHFATKRIAAKVMRTGARGLFHYKWRINKSCAVTKTCLTGVNL